MNEANFSYIQYLAAAAAAKAAESAQSTRGHASRSPSPRGGAMSPLSTSSAEAAATTTAAAAAAAVDTAATVAAHRSKRAGGGPRAPICDWYDGLRQLSDDGDFRGTCKICKKSISAKYTSNLISHMKRKHPGYYSAGLNSNHQSKLSGSAAAAAAAADIYVQSTRLNSLVDFLADSLVSPKLIDSADFHRFVDALNPNFDLPSSRQFIKNALPCRKREIQRKMTEVLQEVEYVVITQDVWSNLSGQSVVCLSAHFVHDWKLKMVFLASKHFTQPDIESDLAEFFEETIYEHNLSEKVSHTVANNATELTRSAKASLPGLHPEEVKLLGSSSTISMKTSIDLKNMNSASLEGMTCFAEALETCVTLATKDNAVLESVLSKVSQVLDYVRMIVSPGPALEELQAKLEQGHSTWNLQLGIIRAITSMTHERLRDALSDVYSFMPEDYAVLTELVEVLEPFEEAYNLFREGHRVTVSFIIPCIRGLTDHLQKVKPVHLQPVVEKLSQFIHKDLAKYEANETYALCSILDPRFKLAWCPEKQQSSLTALLRRKASQIVLPESNAITSASEERPSRLFQFMPSQEANSVEVGRYLVMPCLPNSSTGCPLEFWRQHQKEFPSLCQLACSLMNIPAAANHVLQMSRVQGADSVTNLADIRLNASTFESLMFVKMNVALLRS